MATAGPIVTNIERAGFKAWQAAKYGGGAVKEALTSAKGTLAKGDEFFRDQITEHQGSVGKAVVGIAKKWPVSSALATTAVVGGTVYGAKKILGPHTQRAVTSANDNERYR